MKVDPVFGAELGAETGESHTIRYGVGHSGNVPNIIVSSEIQCFLWIHLLPVHQQVRDQNFTLALLLVESRA